MRKLILILTGIAVVSLSFVIGRWWGSGSASERLMHEEMKRWDERAVLDRKVLQGFPVRSNTMSSGSYLMDVWFPTSKLPTREVVLNCEDGQITASTFSRSRGPRKFSLDGSVVSWSQEGALYQADAKYVGLVDGDVMWGRVYGWNPGDESMGLWRIYRKPDNSGQLSSASNQSQPVRPATNPASAVSPSGR